jgi:hypothetical protein
VNQAVTIDRYMTDMAGVLTGPKALKKDLLAEARCGLEDAAQAYRKAGAVPEDAEDLAVRDFGLVSEVAPGYQRELAMAQARRTACWLLAFVAAQLIWSKARWKSDGGWRGHHPGGAYLLFSHLWSWSELLIAAVAAVAVVSFGMGVRYIPAPWRLTRSLGLLTLLALAARAGASTVFLLMTPHLTAGIAGQAHAMPGMLFALMTTLALWIVPDGYIAMSALRCLTVGGARRIASVRPAT